MLLRRQLLLMNARSGYNEICKVIHKEKRQIPLLFSFEGNTIIRGLLSHFHIVKERLIAALSLDTVKYV